jgi:hypothetical protein
VDRVPVVERIVQDVVDTLGRVRVSGGFNVDLFVERPKPGGTNWRDGTTVVYLGARVPTEDGERPQQYEQWYQTVVVVFCAVETDLTKDLDTKLSTATADIHQALCASAALRRRDDWAITTVPGDVIPLERDLNSNEAKVLLEFTVQYRHNWGDPYACPFRD